MTKRLNTTIRQGKRSHSSSSFDSRGVGSTESKKTGLRLAKKILKRRQGPGILLLSPSREILGVNQKARTVLEDLHEEPKAHSLGQLPTPLIRMCEALSGKHRGVFPLGATLHTDVVVQTVQGFSHIQGIPVFVRAGDSNVGMLFLMDRIQPVREEVPGPRANAFGFSEREQRPLTLTNCGV